MSRDLDLTKKKQQKSKDPDPIKQQEAIIAAVKKDILEKFHVDPDKGFNAKELTAKVEKNTADVQSAQKDIEDLKKDVKALKAAQAQSSGTPVAAQPQQAAPATATPSTPQGVTPQATAGLASCTVRVEKRYRSGKHVSSDPDDCRQASPGSEEPVRERFFVNTRGDVKRLTTEMMEFFDFVVKEQ
ncbi:hypothetical protein J5491_03120 [Candidatus Saccharibacteria bacterium]|nr:hypothetical protein [Candidatus Saccharibacteria bacterium]